MKTLNKYNSGLVNNSSTGTLMLNNVLLMTGLSGLSNAGNATVVDSTVTGMGNVGIRTYSLSGTTGLTVRNSVISNNEVGGIYGDNLLIENTLLTGNVGEKVIDINSGKIINSTITGNTGHGVYIEFNSTGIEIINSTISNNQYHGYDPSGAGVYIGGYATKIVGSTISGNTAGQNGGGIFSFHSVTITNSTISGNTAENDGGGIYFYGDNLTLNDVTITGNSALSGGGIYANSGSIKPANTILYGNSGTVSGGDCYDTGNHLVSQGNNVLGDSNSCPNFTASGDQVGVNPLLSPLANNGGSTKTHALQTGSPAINAGNPLTCIGYDQRYYPRNGTCDIGAYEADAPASTVTPTFTPTATATTDPNVTPTPTYTPTQEGVTELLTNGGFEAKNGDSPSLAPWTLSNGSKDKIKCNTLTKTVAYEGDCAFLFKGGAGENAKLSQTGDSAGSFSIGDIVVLNLYANAKGAVNMKAKVKVTYSDDTAPDKINLTIDATSGYELLQGYTFLLWNSVSKIKMQILNHSASGKIYLDAISLLHGTMAAGLQQRGQQQVLPLP